MNDKDNQIITETLRPFLNEYQIIDVIMKIEKLIERR